MSENGSSPKDNDTSSSSSGNTDANDSLSSGNTDANDSSSAVGWKVQYKAMPKSESKGIWAGYQTREEFLMMHLR